MDNPLPRKELEPPMCRLAIAAMVLLVFPIAFITLIFLLSLITDIGPDQPTISLFLGVFGVLSLISFIASTLVGLTALFIIRRFKMPIRGKTLAGIVVTSSTVIGLFVFSLPYQGRIKPFAQRFVCTTNLKGLVRDIQGYAKDHADSLPTDLWCDRLIQNCDISPKSLVCPASELIEGECSYALNKHILNHKLSELPSDIILLFETKTNRESEKKEPIQDRESFSRFSIVQELLTTKEPVVLQYWNQIAGPEALSTANHNYQGCNIAFADGHAEWIMYDKLSTLKWSLDDPGLHWIPETIPDKYIRNTDLFRVSGYLLLMALVSLMLFKKWQLAFSVLCIIISSGIGLLGGQLLELNVYSMVSNNPLGYRVGLIWGGIAGIVYAISLIKIFSSKEEHHRYNLFIGVFIGIASAILIDMTFMVYYNSYDLWSLPLAFYGGIPIGAGVATVLSKVFDLVIDVKINSNQNASVTLGEKG